MSEQELSKEWIELVKEAMQSNASKEKFKEFLKEEKEKREYNNSGINRRMNKNETSSSSSMA